MQSNYCGPAGNDTICQTVFGRHGTEICAGTILGVRIVDQYYRARTGTRAYRSNSGREGGAVGKVQAEGESIDENTSRRSSGSVFWSETWSGCQNHQAVGDRREIHILQAGLLKGNVR